MDSATKPSVLFAYFTYTNQTRKVIDAMAEVLRGRGCDVTLAAIGFTDPRYACGFRSSPMLHPFRELVGMIPAESPRRRPAKIAIPDAVTEREYDLVVIGSPTWWLSTFMSVWSFLQSGTASQVLKGKPLTCCRVLPPVLETQPEDRPQARHRLGRHPGGHQPHRVLRHRAVAAGRRRADLRQLGRPAALARPGR